MGKCSRITEAAMVIGRSAALSSSDAGASGGVGVDVEDAMSLVTALVMECPVAMGEVVIRRGLLSKLYLVVMLSFTFIVVTCNLVNCFESCVEATKLFQG